MTLFSRVFLPFLLFSYIAIETYLKLNHSSLCEATGCKLAGELLHFDPIYLNYLGIASVFTLMILGYLSLKSKLMEKLFFMVLYGAIAFEATILGYQFFVNPEPCIFCMGIFSSLLLIALLSQLKNFVLIATVALSIFIGLGTLAFSKNETFITTNGVYLIQSKGCSHCTKVKTYFEENHIKYTPISVQEASARSFLKFAGITSIPVLITKDATGISMLVGDHKIITHYEAQNTVIAVPLSIPNVPIGQSSVGLPIDLFKATEEPGCAVTIAETVACDKNTSH